MKTTNRTRRAGALALAVLGLTACDPASAPSADSVSDSAAVATSLQLVRGYRGADDPCQLVGESAQTVNFLDHTADLVGCPAGSSASATFVAETGATPLDTLDGYDLFTVPRG